MVEPRCPKSIGTLSILMPVRSDCEGEEKVDKGLQLPSTALNSGLPAGGAAGFASNLKSCSGSTKSCLSGHRRPRQVRVSVPDLKCPKLNRHKTNQ